MPATMRQIPNLKLNMKRILEQYPVSATRHGDYYIYSLSKKECNGKHFVQVQEGVPFSYQDDPRDESFLVSLLESGCRISIVDCPKGSCQAFSLHAEWIQILYEQIIKKYPTDDLFLSGNYSSGMSSAIIQIMKDIYLKQNAS